MVSVTQRIKEINQPRGGYLPIKLFSVEQFEDHRVLNPVESVSPSLVGICVDYLTRFMKGAEASRETAMDYAVAPLWISFTKGRLKTG